MQYVERVEEGLVGRVSSMISTAFGSPPDECEEWVRNQGLTDLRGVQQADGLALDGCLRRIEMGQFWGGRSVPMIGIAGVATAPESRGRGVARFLMQSCLEEMHRHGEPISVLYPSTQALYRQSGYEQAGHRMACTIPIGQLAGLCGKGDKGAWEEVPWEKMSDLVPCWKQYAARFDGTLDRGEYIWKRVYDWRKRKAGVYATRDASGKVEAYLAVAIKVKDNGRQSLEVADAAFADQRGARRLLTFLHDYASMADEAVFMLGAAGHPLLMLLDQQRHSVAFKEVWMLRVVRPLEALRTRGYAGGVQGRVTIDLHDASLPANSGLFTLEVSGGQAQVKTGTSAGPTVQLTERGLAALFAGYASGRTLRDSGQAEGEPADLDLATLLISGGSAGPRGGGGGWTVDFF